MSLRTLSRLERGFFLFYLLLAFALVSLHDFRVLAFSALLFLLVDPRLAKRALLAEIFFTLGVTLAYLLRALWMPPVDWGYLLTLNLRVFVVTFLTLYTVRSLNLSRVFAFSPTLQFLYTAALSQIESYRASYRDFMLALKSRTLKPMRERKRYDFLRAMLHYFAVKSMHNATERTAALKARGFFDRA